MTLKVFGPLLAAGAIAASSLALPVLRPSLLAHGSFESPGDIRVFTVPAAAPAGSPFLPFGLKGMDVGEIGQPPFSAAQTPAHHSADTLRQAAEAARRHRVKLFIRLTGSRTRFQNADGSFSLAKWKKDLDRLRGFDAGPYVADGTVIAAELINEPEDPNNWGRTIVSKADMEAAAAYAKAIWPTLPVGGGRSDYLQRYGPWQHVDFGMSQYAKRKGDIESWRRQTVAASKAAGVALILSLNIAGGEVRKRPLAADDIRRLGSVLARDDYACMLTGYQYDAAYLTQPAVMDAFRAIAAIAASHPAPPCYTGEAVKP